MPLAAFPFEIVFGNIKTSKLSSQNAIYDCYLKQTHSDRVITVSNKSYVTQEGDALFCKQPGFRLLIKTADCLPIVMVDPERLEYAIVHAGWRGVANQITIKTLQHFSQPNNVRVWIGPHIQVRSFEVDQVTAQALYQAIPELHQLPEVYKQVVQPHSDPTKAWVNMSLVIRYQLISQGVLPHNIEVLSQDTKTDPLYHSYRRDQTPLRNVSFVALSP